MKKQIGNDVRLEWTILRKGVAEDFTDATDLALTAFIPNLSIDELILPIARAGNVFTLNIPTTDLSIGTYTIRLQYKKPDPAFTSGKASISTAVNGAFQVVPIGASEDDLNDELTSNVVYCTDGATFIPSVSVVDNEIILSWTNDKGYTNPSPINIKGDKGDVGKSAYEYYLENTTEPVPMTEEEFSTMLGTLPIYVQNAILATNNANNAATNANNAANTATQAAQDADAATLLANTAAANADTKALYAQGQGDYAKAQGDYAHEQGLAAYTAANQAIATNDSVVAAESLRVSAESSRVTAESNRVSQEDGRISAENARVSSESGRVNAESARVTAESGRVTAESGRVTAESGRVTAENARVANEEYRNKYVRAAEFDKRVTADSGSIKDRISLFDSYRTALNLLPNTRLAYSPEMGVKQSVSGLVYKATKLYDMSQNNNDGSQSTAGSQPYIGGNVAPNERMWLWGLSKTMAFTPISFNATDKWSACIVADIVGSSADFIGSTNTRITFNNAATDSITFKNESATSVSFNVSKFGGTRRIYLVAQGNGSVQVWINGFLQGSITNPSNVTLNTLFGGLNAKGKSIRVFNKDLSKAEIEGLDKFLSSIYPEYETSAIGSQAWVTSNHLGNVISDGFVIPEVQGNDAATNPELLINGNFESGLVGTMNNSSGGATATYTLNTINPINGTQDGRLQVTAAGTSNLRPFLNFGAVGFMQSGKRYKIKLDYKVNSGTCILTSVYDGAHLNINKTLSSSGTLELGIFLSANWELALYFDGRNLFDLQIDNISVKEAGWADAQLLYDTYIGAGRSSLEATKAASMWCKYNNSDDNAAVYGYILNGHTHNYLKYYAPKALRLGGNNDWAQMFTTLGGNSVAGKKLKKEGLVYWSTTNSGTNENGFTAIGGGRRNADGTFANIGTEATFRTADGNVISVLNNSDAVTSTSADLRIGTSLRFLKNAPSGLSEQELDTGLFTTDIATAQKELPMSFGHKVTEIKVNSLTNNLTNFKVELRNSAGVLLITLVQGVTITANSPIDIPILVTQPMLFQDAKLWITATGNTGATNLGMQVKVLTKQNMY